MNKSNVLVNQIEKTIKLLKVSFDPLNPWFVRTLKLYEEARESPTEKNLRKLLGLSRAYLETESDWSQDFFIETDRTEQMLKTHFEPPRLS